MCVRVYDRSSEKKKKKKKKHLSTVRQVSEIDLST